MIENNNEPIITQNCGIRYKSFKHRSAEERKTAIALYVATFSGMLYCTDCGYKMKQIWINRQNKSHGTGYTCGYHAHYGSNYCTTYTIKGNVLETFIIADIQSKLHLIVDEFIRRLKKYADFKVLTREMLLELVEYITIKDVQENRNELRTIHIYYKFLDKTLTNKQNTLV